MANPFYGATGNPVAVTRGTSSLIRAEFTAIQSGFDSVLARFTSTDTTISAKGAIAGQTWTGTHDFTGATIKVPTRAYGASGSFAASLDFVNTALLNAIVNLPGQTGNAGKILMTNGTTATWTQLYPTQTGKANRVLRTDGANVSWLPGGDLAITGNGTIDFGSYLIAGNYNITLPDLTAGLPLVLSVPSNSTAGTIPSTITTSDGWTITTGFAAGTAATIMPLRTDTAHGWWGSLSMSPKMLTQVTVNAGSSSPVVQSSVQLSATCIVLAIGDTVSNAVALVAVDPTTGNVGNVVALTSASTTNGSVASLFPIGTTGFIYAFSDGANSNRASAYAATLSGLTITGATTVISSSTSGLCDTVVQFGTTSTFLAAINTATASADLVAFSVSGTTVTVGTAIGSGAVASSVATRIMGITNTTALVCYATSASTNVQHSARVVSVAGLVLTAGTPATTNIATLFGGTAASSNCLFQFSSGTYLYYAPDATTGSNGNWFLITVSGTATTVNNAVVSTTKLSQRVIDTNITAATRGVGALNIARTAFSFDATHIGLVTSGNALCVASYSGSTLTLSAPTGTTHATLITDLSGANVYSTQTSSGTTYTKLTLSGGALNIGTPIAAWPSSIWTDNLNDAVVTYAGTAYKWTGVPAAALPIATDKYVSLSGTTLTVYGSFA